MARERHSTPEEVKHLRDPYTLQTSPDSISYYLTFNGAFWAISLQSYTSLAVFHKLVYNTEGQRFKHIYNTAKCIQRAAKSPEGLSEGLRRAADRHHLHPLERKVLISICDPGQSWS